MGGTYATVRVCNALQVATRRAWILGDPPSLLPVVARDTQVCRLRTWQQRAQLVLSGHKLQFGTFGKPSSANLSQCLPCFPAIGGAQVGSRCHTQSCTHKLPLCPSRCGYGHSCSLQIISRPRSHLWSGPKSTGLRLRFFAFAVTPRVVMHPTIMHQLAHARVAPRQEHPAARKEARTNNRRYGMLHRKSSWCNRHQRSAWPP